MEREELGLDPDENSGGEGEDGEGGQGDDNNDNKKSSKESDERPTYERGTYPPDIDKIISRTKSDRDTLRDMEKIVFANV